MQPDFYIDMKAEEIIYACNNIKRVEAERNEAKSELERCRNELCLKCGCYKEAHNGACDGCRWRH